MVMLVIIKSLWLKWICPKRLFIVCFISLFEWVVMTLRLKNASETYKRAMNLIFHDLLVIILEVYIDDVVVKLDRMDSHLAHLCWALETMCRYGLKMNPLKCVFDVSASKFLGFIIHEHGIEIDPTKIESINKVQLPQCKNDMQKFLGKLNYLRRFISNLSGKISAFAHILRLKNEVEFTWGIDQQCAFEEIKRYLSSPSVMKAPMAGIPFRLYTCGNFVFNYVWISFSIPFEFCVQFYLNLVWVLFSISFDELCFQFCLNLFSIWFEFCFQ
jgi:hypothetical protein